MSLSSVFYSHSLKEVKDMVRFRESGATAQQVADACHPGGPDQVEILIATYKHCKELGDSFIDIVKNLSYDEAIAKAHDLPEDQMLLTFEYFKLLEHDHAMLQGEKSFSVETLVRKCEAQDRPYWNTSVAKAAYCSRKWYDETVIVAGDP